MAAASKSVVDNYEYMDETKIDAELICTICANLFKNQLVFHVNIHSAINILNTGQINIFHVQHVDLQ
jgi:hypothetical protein